MSANPVDMESIKTRMKSTWMAGDYGVIARTIDSTAAEFVARLGLKPGMRVLDIACGTGNVAIPAARTGANVTGADIAANLLEQARARAASENLSAQFDEGDAEQLPYPDQSFDIVVSMFGMMFAPRPELAAKELLRVCRSGGQIALGNWTPDAFPGTMFKSVSRHVPPPPGVPPPAQWGDESIVRQRLGSGVKDLEMTRRKCPMHFPFPPAEVVNHFRTYFGPVKQAFAALDPGKQESLRRDLVEAWAANNHAAGNATDVEAEYLEILATRA